MLVRHRRGQRRSLVVPRLEARPRLRPAGRGPRRDRDLGRDRRSARHRRRALPAHGARPAGRAGSRSRDRPAGRCTCCGSSEHLPGAGFELAARSCATLRMVKDADEIALLRRPRTRRTGSSPGSPPAGWSAGPRPTSPRGPRAAHRRGPRVGRVRDRRLRAELGLAPPRGVATGSSRPASRSCSTSAGTLGGYCSDITRTLWVTGGDPAKGPDERVPHLFGVLVRGPGGRRRRPSRPGVACEAIDAAARESIDAEGYGEAFFHRTGPRDRARGSRGPVPRRRQPRAAPAGMAFSVEPGIYFDGRVRCAHRGHRRLRPRRAGSAQRGRPRAVRRRRLMRVDRGSCAIIPPTDRAQAVHHRVRDQITRTIQRHDGAFRVLGQQPGADGR